MGKSPIRLLPPYTPTAEVHRQAYLPIITSVVLLAGEWVAAGLGLSISFLVAGLGVVGLGWWVLRGDARNRAAESSEQAPETEHKEAPH